MGRRSLTQPVEELADVLRWFMRSKELRLLWIETDGRMKAPALETATGFEHHADNKSPILSVELTNTEDTNDAWEGSVATLREAYEEHRKGGAPLEAMEARPLGDDGAANFSVQLLQFVSAVQAPAEGLILVLNIGHKAPDDTWLKRIEDMVRSEELAPVRFVVLSGLFEAAEAFVKRFDKGTTHRHRAQVHESVAIQELEAELDTEQELGVGMRGAWPKGIPVPPRPRRWKPPVRAKPPTKPPTTPPTVPPVEGEEEAEVPAEPSTAEEPDLRILVQRAALAMRKKDGPETIRNQAAARDLCVSAGQVRDAITMELMLGGYLLELEQSRLAAEAFGRAGVRAYDNGHEDLAAEAFLAQASAAEGDEQFPEALEAYRHAIEAAQAAPRPTLAIRAYWRAGQTGLRIGLEIETIGLWADAVVYVDKLPEEDRKIPFAKDIAKQLAELLAKHRRYSEAREIERIASGF